MSSQIVRAEFESRVKEVDFYFDFLNRLEDEMVVLCNADLSKQIRLNDEQLKIFKANGFLLLYNLIESTMLNSVISVFDEIKSNGLMYKDLTEQIKNYWLKHKYKHDDNVKGDTVLKKFYNLFEDLLVSMTLEVIDKLEYGGSFDALKVKELAKKLGLSFDPSFPSYNKETHGKVLLDIKVKRNALAHGNHSFAEIGKDITYNGVEFTDDLGNQQIQNFGLRHFKQYTVEYLTLFVQSLEDFLVSQSYRQGVST